MAFANLTAQLNLNISNFASGLSKASGMISGLDRRMQQLTKGTQNATRNITGANSATEKHNLSLKDTARIVQGILVSQAFYQIMNDIKSATSAVYEFTSSLEMAEVAYTALFNSADLSKEFVQVLQNYAADTIFDFQDLEKTTRKLLAYGIEYKNVMYLTKGIVAGASLEGDPTTLLRVARAMGQIYTKGKVSAEEMQQLADAGIPAYDILEKKLGLTKDQLADIGNAGISASVGLNAIIEGLKERFGDVSTAVVYTMKGMLSNVKDNLLFIGSTMFQPIYDGLKALTRRVLDWLNGLRSALNSGGLKGLFEQLVPPEWQKTIKLFFANMLNLLTVLRHALETFGSAFMQIFGQVIQLMNVILPIITPILDILVRLMKVIVQNSVTFKLLTTTVLIASAALALYRLQVLKALVTTALSKALGTLARMFSLLGSVIAKGPVRALLVFVGVLVGALAFISMFSTKARDMLNNILGIFTKLNGIGADDIFSDDSGVQDTTSDIGKFDDALGDVTNSLDDMGNAAEKAGNKAKKSLLSFDEVFKLNEDAGSVDSGLANLGDLGNLFDGISGGIGNMEVPDMSGWASDFVDGLFGDVWDKVKAYISGGSLGALIGALAGFAIGAIASGGNLAAAIAGGKLGAGLGLIAGVAITAIIENLRDGVKTALQKVVVGGSIGALVGGLAGFIIGWLVTKDWKAAMYGGYLGAAIGGIAGAGIGAIVASLTSSVQTALPSMAVSGAIGGLIGGLAGFIFGYLTTKNFKSALYAASIGAGLGSIASAGIQAIWQTLNDNVKSTIERTVAGGSMGGLLGMLVGFAIGGIATKTLPGAIAGAKLGAVLGTAVGGLLGGIWTDWTSTIEQVITGGSMGSGIGALVGALVGFAIGGLATASLPGAIAGASIGGTIGSMIGTGVQSFWTSATEETKTAIANITAGASIGALLGGLLGFVIGGLVAGLPGALAGAKIGAGVGAVVGTVVSGFWDEITGAFSSAFEGTGELATDWGEVLGGIVDNIKEAFENGDWLSVGTNIVAGIISGILAAFSLIGSAVASLFTAIFTAICAIFDIQSPAGTMVPVGEYIVLGIIEGFTATIGQFLSTIVNFGLQVIAGIGNWFTSVGANIGTWATNVGTAISTWATNAYTTVSTWATNAGTTISTWATNAYNAISTWASNALSTFVTWVSTTLSNIGSWASGVAGSASTAMSNLGSNIMSGLNSAARQISTFCSNMLSTLGSWASSVGRVISRAIDSARSTASSIGGWVSSSVSNLSSRLSGHAEGGVFNREHIARFAEGNKAEAVIPLEDNQAMQPFVDAIANGITASLAPALATSGGSGSGELRPLYVGTLVADERGLKELNRKMRIIDAQEERRR